MSVHLRRVGFRDGTDDELAALWTVEAPIEVERRPDLLAVQPLESYRAFARALPSRYHDHTWIGELDDGTPVASAACWWNAAGDPAVMECDVFVHRDHRRSGVGTRLMRLVVETTEEAGRTSLLFSTFDAVPAGDAFARRLGAVPGRVNRTSELRLDALDWSMVSTWSTSSRGRALGYRLEAVDGPFPPALRADALVFHRIMNTQPHDDLDVGDIVLSESDVEERYRAEADAGRVWWTLLVRAPDGTCVGGTEVLWEPWQPTVVLQQNTGIDPAHRGLGLAKWAKAAMLEWVRTERPFVERVRTGNAFSNAPMLAINDALGFEVISAVTNWQVPVATVRAAIGS